MNEENPRFWAAIVGAVIIKVLMSQNLKPVNAALTVIAGIYSGWAFTPFVMDLLGLAPTTQNLIVVAALTAITGENVIRQVITFTRSENIITDLLKLWLGNKK